MARAPFVARWDLDKTYLRTEFDSVRDLLRTAVERADQKRTVPGAASLLRELSKAGARIHILSGSPRQMRGRIEEKLRLDGAKFESLTLKPNLENFLRLRLRALRDQLGYKLPALLRARATLTEPQDESGNLLKEVLLGDDAEADAFVYSLYADLCAEKVELSTLEEVMQIGNSYDDVIEETLRFARLVDKGPHVERILIHLERQSSPRQFHQLGSRVVPFYNYFQAALVIAEDGRLPAAGVVRVAAEMVIEHRFDGERLARSYLDLKRRKFVRGDLVPALQDAIETLAADTRLPALLEVRKMCDSLAERLAEMSEPSPPREVPVPDYVALVKHHNHRKKRKFRGILSDLDMLPTSIEVAAGGLRFPVLTWGDTGPWVLCLHGFPDNPYSFEALAPKLVSAGYRVLAPTLRGYAPGAIPKPARYQISHSVSDTLAILEQLSTGPVAVVGHDYGGAVALALAAEEPQMVTSLATLAIPFPLGVPAVFHRHLPQIGRSWYMGFFQFPLAAETLLAKRPSRLLRLLWSRWSPNFQCPEEHMQRLEAMFAQPGVAQATIRWYRHAFRPWTDGGKETAELFERPIRQRVLAMGGLADGCIGADLLRESYASPLLRGGAEVAQFPQVGHFLHMENPDVVATRLLSFLKSNAH